MGRWWGGREGRGREGLGKSAPDGGGWGAGGCPTCGQGAVGKGTGGQKAEVGWQEPTKDFSVSGTDGWAELGSRVGWGEGSPGAALGKAQRWERWVGKGTGGAYANACPLWAQRQLSLGKGKLHMAIIFVPSLWSPTICRVLSGRFRP